MPRPRTLFYLAILLATASACGGDSAPTAPSGASGNTPSGTPAAGSTATALSIMAPAKTVFIADTVQLDARETLTDGSTRSASGVTWTSSNANIATVSSTGILSATGPGEVTITASTAQQATQRIRVYPNFAGAWRGVEVFATCTDTEDLDGVCAELGGVGEQFLHESTFTQTEAAVSAIVDAGDGVTAQMSGTVTLDGEAQLGTAPLNFGDPDAIVEIRNWRSRANQPGQMTGSYEIVIMIRGAQGQVTMGVQLQNVTKVGAPAAGIRATAAAGVESRRRLLEKLRLPATKKAS